MELTDQGMCIEILYLSSEDSVIRLFCMPVKRKESISFKMQKQFLHNHFAHF